MKFAYADPPYLGMGKRYADQHPEALSWNNPETHRQLIVRLCGEFDAWAMSLSSVTLRTILPMCPEDARVMAWVKPFAVFRPNVNPAYCWEPMIVLGGRRRSRAEPTVRDFCVSKITLETGTIGAKSETFCHWMFDVLGAGPGDNFNDLFPGSGAVSRAWTTWLQMHRAWEVAK